MFCLQVYLYTMCMPCAHRGQKVSGVTVSYKQTCESSCKLNIGLLKEQPVSLTTVISPAPCNFFCLFSFIG